MERRAGAEVGECGQRGQVTMYSGDGAPDRRRVRGQARSCLLGPHAIDVGQGPVTYLAVPFLGKQLTDVPACLAVGLPVGVRIRPGSERHVNHMPISLGGACDPALTIPGGHGPHTRHTVSLSEPFRSDAFQSPGR